MPLTNGQAFAGYTIIRRLGSGGMGEVYLAQHPRLPRQDALKLLPPEWSADADYRARFNREADLASTLWHPNIVGVHDRGEEDGQLWISMDFVDGLDAARFLTDRYPSGMPIEEVVRIVTAVASALDYAHKQGLLHRDVKPSNIMLTHVDDEGEQRILLTDFGIARNLNDISGLTATNMAVGTVAYSAPEQLLGEDVDGRTDQYALAATAYHLLTGSHLFPHSNPNVVSNRHLSYPPPELSITRPELAKLDPVLAVALAKDPNDRFQRCSAFAKALGSQISTPSSGSHLAPTSPASPAQRVTTHQEVTPEPSKPASSRARRSRHWLVAIGAVLLLALLAILWPAQRNSPTTSTLPTATTAPSLRPSATASSGPSGSPQQSTQTNGAQPTVEAAGFGGRGNYLWVTSIVRDTQPGTFITVSFNLLSADGTILATARQVEEGVNPNRRMIIGTQVEAPKGQTVVRVQPTVGVSPDSLRPKFEDVVLGVGGVTVGTNSFNQPTAKAVLTNPSQEQIPGARVGIACFDNQSNIIGGGSTFPGLIPPGGQVMASADVMVSQQPTRCEMTAQPSSF